MKRLVSVVSVAGLLACGSVDEKQGCAVSTDCPAGQYCAHAGGESRCWPDAVPPTASGVSAACTPSPCLRDGVLHVEASVSDDKEVLDASVSLDLYSAQQFPMSKVGGVWAADVPLRVLPFDAFARDVVPTVLPRDGARNMGAGVSGPAVAVTRLKWDRTIDAVAGLSVTAPAVLNDGTVVIGGSNGKVYFVAVDGTNAHAGLTVGTGQITAAPAIGQHAIWVGSEDGNLYAVQLDGSAVIANVGVNLSAPVIGSVAVQAAGAKEWCLATATAGDGTGFIGTSSSSPGENDVASAPAQEGFSAGPVIASEGHIHAPTAALTNSSTLRSYTLATAPIVLTPTWTAPIGKRSTAAIAMDGDGNVLSASDDSTPVLNRTVPGPTPVVTSVGDLSATAIDSAIVLANGDVVIGDQSGSVHRFSASGPVWTPAPNLGSAIRGPMVVTAPTAPFIVPTNAGKVYALADDGHVVWDGTLPSATQLRAAGIYTPLAAPREAITSVAYLSSGNGRLYAVIVDGQLDGAAPWPKAFHDPRNTNHAGPQP
jgi:outer membrane protein assembly factor BamB